MKYGSKEKHIDIIVKRRTWQSLKLLPILYSVVKAVLGSLSKDGGNHNSNDRKQCFDWLNEEKINDHAARVARTLI